jgi:hypothetical protein
VGARVDGIYRGRVVGAGSATGRGGSPARRRLWRGDKGLSDDSDMTGLVGYAPGEIKGLADDSDMTGLGWDKDLSDDSDMTGLVGYAPGEVYN